MRTTRRRFLQTSGLLGTAVFGAGGFVACRSMRSAAGQSPAESLDILILGGTGFLGPHQVRYAMARGHSITLFNRGRTNPHLFPEVEKLKGDRDGDLGTLEGRVWDVVIDNSGYVPRHVALSAELLADSVGQYLFTSTMSVYRDVKQPGMDESYPVGKLEDETVEQVTGETYGPLKALCEDAVRDHMTPARSTVVRPGLIVGPGDTTDRFTYWPVRVADGGRVLAPGTPQDPVSFIDGRDLARWMIHLAEERVTGTFNAVGPRRNVITIGELLEDCVKASGSDAELVWCDAEFLAAHQVSPWQDMPAWVPPQGDYEGFGRASRDAAFSAGLECRPLIETVADTLEWHRTRPADTALRAGISREREAEVLALWDESRKG